MIPKYLYQYTDIDSLEKIYTTKKILFKRLDLLNDPYEGLAKDKLGLEIEKARKYIYCSCWTATSQESIAMWGVYKGFHGIRIKMFSRMFAKSFSLKETNKGFIPVELLTNPIVTSHRNTMTNENVKINQVYGPYSISYVSTVDETYDGSILNSDETNISISNNQIDIKIQELGNRKVDYWKYECEWRYKISPYSDLIGDPQILASINELENEEFYLVPYEGDIVEIMLAPCVEEDTITRLHKLLGERYDSLVKRSEIKMRKI